MDEFHSLSEIDIERNGAGWRSGSGQWIGNGREWMMVENMHIVHRCRVTTVQSKPGIFMSQNNGNAAFLKLKLLAFFRHHIMTWLLQVLRWREHNFLFMLITTEDNFKGRDNFQM